MANVRLDENGLPKGPVYEPTVPLAHRSGVTSVDGADPPDASSGVNGAGYQHCRFDITITGTGFQSLEVQALYWNPRQGLWFGGATRRFEATGRHALLVETRGAVIFLKVTSFAGTSFNLSADYSLS